ncbi:MAG: WD40 repeat domain-containing protein [Cyanobacteria bacterium P01_B01_bin.77]
MPSPTPQTPFKLLLHKTLSDYVTAIAWSLDGAWLVASSAAGDIVRYEVKTGKTTVLQEADGESVDALTMSADGRFLAAGGQAGTVWIWRLEGSTSTLVTTLEHSRAWIDCLQWHPQQPELAFSFGRYVQVWDAITQSVITTLNFESSSVLDLAWHPQGDRLSVSGNQSIKTWRRQDWDEEPTVEETGAASEAIAWSPDGTYFASGNNDCSMLVWEEGNLDSWHMQDFPGKVRQLAWSMPTAVGAPLLAAISSEKVIVWTKDSDPSVGWMSQMLDTHQGILRAIAFQPESLLLASAAEDGLLCLWDKGSDLVQSFEDASAELSCLAWSYSGRAIAAGDSQGNVLVWMKVIL